MSGFLVLGMLPVSVWDHSSQRVSLFATALHHVSLKEECVEKKKLVWCLWLGKVHKRVLCFGVIDLNVICRFSFNK